MRITANDIPQIISQAEEFAMPLLRIACGDNASLLELLTTHSRNVALLAVQCALARVPHADITFIAQAAMLHDIGIVQCNAKEIYCYGTLPYLQHGVAGREMLDNLGLPRHALVCERHTGAGISLQEIELSNMPLPHRTMLPQSVEEKLICYADKFYSKSKNPDCQKELNKVRAGLARYGSATLQRFDVLHSNYGIPRTTHTD